MRGGSRSGDGRARQRGAALAAGLLALILAGCGGRGPQSVATTSTRAAATVTSSLPGTGRPTLTIGDKNTTEQFLLGELYARALSAQGFSVELNQNIGPTEVTLRALAGGLLDMYPENLETWNRSIAGIDRSFATPQMAWAAGSRYAHAHGLALLDPTGFADTPAVVVTDAYAAANHLRRVGDLRRVGGEMAFGGPPQYDQDATGLPALEQAYGFYPMTYLALPLGEQYNALNRDTVQAIEGATSDGELATGGYRLLDDPRHVSGWGQVVPVVPAKTLAEEGPAFVAVVNQVSRLLTLPVMRQLNAAVDLYHQDPGTVAQGFLRSHGLAPTPPSP